MGISVAVPKGVFLLCSGCAAPPGAGGSPGGFLPVVWAVAVLELESQDTSGQQTTESVSS